MKHFLIRLLIFTLKSLFFSCVTGLVVAFVAICGLLLYLEPKLPPIDNLRDIRLQVPLRVYSRDQKLIAEFGEIRRIPVIYEHIPPKMIRAFLAAEDDRFFEHPGVDYQGLLRAALHVIKTGSKGQGGSTITMQVARNFFLSSEKTYLRKANEILLSFKIEKELSKEQILELYLNRIFLGQRAYGIGAAAYTYYGKTLEELELHEIAMIAGLPKAPSTMNPITNAARARTRRDYVLGRLLTLGDISSEEYEAARAMPTETELHYLNVEVHAPHFAEMIRSQAVELLGDEAYTRGYEIRTSLDSRLQQAANRSFSAALLDYDRRHGYRGPEAHHTLSSPIQHEELDRMIAVASTVKDLIPGIVTAVDKTNNTAEIYLGKENTITLPFSAMDWAREYRTSNALGPKIKSVTDVLSPGDQIRLTYNESTNDWKLAQIPAVEGALVALDPQTGDILSMVGGFDFNTSKFNRATQAKRQAGSAFKPFIYALAIENGFTAASIINDAPVVFDDPALESSWRPENYSGRFYGPTRLREALAKSRNLVSIRLLQSLPMKSVINGLIQFGFDRTQLPADLSLSLGSAGVTPLQLASAYAVFANGGHRIEPNTTLELIDSSTTKTIWQQSAVEMAEDCTSKQEQDFEQEETEDSIKTAAPRCAPRILSPQGAFIAHSLLQDVIRQGTGRRALSIGRTDLAGKTGTTNEVKDAWFVGYNQKIVTAAWMGFDQATTLGTRETGGRSALPMWIDFMQEALDSREQIPFERPPGIVSIRINRQTGYSTSSQDPNSMVEFFIDGHLPPAAPSSEFLPVTGGAYGAPDTSSLSSDESIF